MTRPQMGPRGCALAGAFALALCLAAFVSPGNSQPAPPPPGISAVSAMQLDQMLAPVALYPDQLLGQILMAATYPLEVVQADRWLQDPANAALRGQQLLEAISSQPWDESVKSLVAFPQILSAMDNNLSWTEELGDAFIAHQDQVMDRVQQLRARAQAAHTLISTPQQLVTDTGQAIEINPVGPDTVYVPEYDPNVVYGAWPYYDNPPDDFELPDYAPGGFIAFAILAPLWGWSSWDWRDHRLDIGPVGGRPGRPNWPAGRPGPWKHDPQHRHGVPYGNDTAHARVRGAGEARTAPGEFRGFAPAPSIAQPARELHGATAAPRGDRPAAIRAEPHDFAASRGAPAVPMRAPPPALESFGRGSQVHAQEQRGASSRMSAPASGGRGRR